MDTNNEIDQSTNESTVCEHCGTELKDNEQHNHDVPVEREDSDVSEPVAVHQQISTQE